MLEHIKTHINILCCPKCAGELKVSDNEICCLTCEQHYRIESDIPLLFWSHDWIKSKNDVTDSVKEFYEKSPFPDYEDIDSVASLIQKAQRTFFANLLNEQVPFNTKVLEVGCGTGQMSNYLGIAQRHVFGVDMCLNSLKLGQKFKTDNDLGNIGFYQMNLFQPIFKAESFHLIICNGVLHHTGDPYSGFKSIATLLKKGGYIIIGLYNKYGRLITDFRRAVFKFSGDRFKSLDPRLRTDDRGMAKRDSWFADQYKHPHESKHTIGEVLHWFDETGFDFMYGIPNPKAFTGFNLTDSIFKKHSRGSWFDHFITQTNLFLHGSNEGGFYIMIGKKK